MKLVVAQAAVADLTRLHVFLADKNPAAADKAVSTLAAAIQSLDLFPERGRPSATPNVRELIVPFGQANYVLRYAYLAPADEVVVIRIWHSREARE
jgi:plasmid stabilization system protein ParE